jgi:hypothetical protein
MLIEKLSVVLIRYKDQAVQNLLQFFRAGRSAYVFICGLLLIVLSGVIMLSAFYSREAKAAPPGWETFVAVRRNFQNNKSIDESSEY